MKQYIKKSRKVPSGIQKKNHSLLKSGFLVFLRVNPNEVRTQKVVLSCGNAVSENSLKTKTASSAIRGSFLNFVTWERIELSTH
jgi:hypothetical protein